MRTESCVSTETPVSKSLLSLFDLTLIIGTWNLSFVVGFETLPAWAIRINYGALCTEDFLPSRDFNSDGTPKIHKMFTGLYAYSGATIPRTWASQSLMLFGTVQVQVHHLRAAEDMESQLRSLCLKRISPIWHGLSLRSSQPSAHAHWYPYPHWLLRSHTLQYCLSSGTSSR